MLHWGILLLRCLFYYMRNLIEWESTKDEDKLKLSSWSKFLITWFIINPRLKFFTPPDVMSLSERSNVVRVCYSEKFHRTSSSSSSDLTWFLAIILLRHFIPASPVLFVEILNVSSVCRNGKVSMCEQLEMMIFYLIELQCFGKVSHHLIINRDSANFEWFKCLEKKDKSCEFLSFSK